MTVVKKAFVNAASCPIGGKDPGERFLLPVEEDGITPVDMYWRKRVADGAVRFDPPSEADKIAAAAVKPRKADKGTA